GIRLNVNGVTKQSSNTKHFIFKIEDLISYISQFFTFERGDVIYTGTPDGVAQTGPGDRLEALLLSPADTVLASLNVEVQ
ncbi:MAG TPA: hypothetical protein DEP53_10685, partial [Bacteroidetes bacterium]|nr:hypothetical protein [Bacteroidota bacterium]